MKNVKKSLLNLFATVVAASYFSFAAASDKADLVPNAQLLDSGKVSVKNIGKSEARATWLTIQCLAAGGCPEHPDMAAYENAKFPNAVAIKVPALGAGESFTHELAFWAKLVFKPGQYKFLVLADAGFDIPEVNELNNKTYYVKTVSKKPSGFSLKK